MIEPSTPPTNGHQPAPRPPRGAAVVPTAPTAPTAPSQPARGPARPPTVFPPRLRFGGLDEALFLAGRTTLAGFPLLRVVLALSLFLALVWLAGGLPGGGVIAGLWVLIPLVAMVMRAVAARRNFVHFVADSRGPAATVAEAPLLPPEKLPVYLWGRLEVGARVRDFAALPGFYRTFSTREHALIGQCAPLRWGPAAWPDAEHGLWYAFCTPEQLMHVQPGRLRWGGESYAALALTRHAARQRESGQTRRSVETLYMAALEEAVIARIYGDLLLEARRSEGVTAGP